MEYLLKAVVILGIAFGTYQYVDYATPQELPPIVFELEDENRWVRCSKPEYCYQYMEAVRDLTEPLTYVVETPETQLPLKGEGQRGRSCLPY